MSNNEKQGSKGMKNGSGSDYPMGDALTIQRLKIKLEKKSRKITALRRDLEATKIQLESAKLIPTQDYQRGLEKAFKEVLTNVRFIPVFSLRSNDKVVEVKVSDKE